MPLEVLRWRRIGYILVFRSISWMESLARNSCIDEDEGSTVGVYLSDHRERRKELKKTLVGV